MTSSDDQPYSTRLKNFKAVAEMFSLTQAGMGQRLAKSQAAIQQYMSGRIKMQRNFCALVEQEFGLAPGALDNAGGELQLKDGDGLQPGPAPSDDRGSRLRASTVRASSPLHSAVVDALVRVLVAGKLSDDQCAQMLSRFTLMLATSPTSPTSRNAELDGILARLRVNGFRVLYTAEGGRDEAGRRLTEEFDPTFAASVSRHLCDLEGLTERARREVLRGIEEHPDS